MQKLWLLFFVMACSPSKITPLVHTEKSTFSTDDASDTMSDDEQSGSQVPLKLGFVVTAEAKYLSLAKVFSSSLSEKVELSEAANLVFSTVTERGSPPDKKTTPNCDYSFTGAFSLGAVKTTGKVLWVDAFAKFKVRQGTSGKVVQAFIVKERCNGEDPETVFQKCAYFLGATAEREVWSKLASLN